jgi:hypothetical protein
VIGKHSDIRCDSIGFATCAKASESFPILSDPSEGSLSALRYPLPLWPLNDTEKDKSMAYQGLNPATGKLLQTFPDLTDKELEVRLAIAASCFQAWRHKTYAERAFIVAKAAALVHDQAETFARTMTLELGKRIGEARGSSTTYLRCGATI